MMKSAKPKKVTGNDQRAKIKRAIILGDERKIRDGIGSKAHQAYLSPS